MKFIHSFFFDIYPYLVFTVFLIGSLLRYDYGQYSWRASSSQLLSKKGMRWASNLFHIGIIGIFFGHLVGLLTPHWVYAPLISAHHKQLLAMIAGGIFGMMVLIGGGFLAHRRLANPRIRATSSYADILVILILVVQVCLGLLTIVSSTHHLDGSMMLKLSQWAQQIVTFNGQAAQNLVDVPLIFKLHIILGLTIFLIFPFTRLVHIWSIPLTYLIRRYQIVRTR
ncbi:respiratory nitrate reductase subunit gamma [Candidatus Schmidhempelia bombi]|uniref:nitrate reductase (quinone) n=1 Tax=Candidatus Schmidhempelia bombi str. Bimp TaxID=1387197 RepID=A0AB94IEG9_9GAMM|nr:respiratory nitrate reductase subunit gamma [Candidatus Schmidhempelia bombi]TEA27887.1 respiratory nitrate reductase subunit gamma [Candidatus Schmidhempelia bombi str. Bimp]